MFFNPNCLWQEFSFASWDIVAHQWDRMHFAPIGSLVLLPACSGLSTLDVINQSAFHLFYLFFFFANVFNGLFTTQTCKTSQFHLVCQVQRTSLSMRDTGLVCTHLQTEARRFTCAYSRTLTHTESAWLQSRAPRAGLLINEGEGRQEKGGRSGGVNGATLDSSRPAGAQVSLRRVCAM